MPTADVPEVPAVLSAGLNDAQAAAVAHRAGPLLVVAGPGSGKTRVITTRIAALLADGVPSWRILAVTFTNKAAAEMADRVAALVPPGAELPPISTFHAACVKMLRRFPGPAGLTPGFSIVDAADAARLVGRALTATGREPDPQLARQVAGRISWLKNHGVDPAAVPGDHHLDPVVAAVWPRYRSLLGDGNLVDFDDLLLGAATALDDPDVAAFYTSRVAHVLVDEFQDTNPVQYRIARALSAGTGNLCVVGDPQQSIYGWRGSFPAIVQTFLDDHPDAVVVRLEANYRSTRAITDLAAEVIAGDDTGVDFTSRSVGDGGTAPVAVVADDDTAEAAWAAQRVRSLDGSAAILVRTNAQTRAFEEALTRAGVAHQVVGTVRFWERAEVKDALAWLRLVVNPQDRLAFERAVAAPARGIGPAALAALVDLAETTGADLPSALHTAVADTAGGGDWPLPARSRGPFAGFAAALATVTAAAERGPQAALAAVLTATGLRESWGKGAEATERLQNLSELARTAEGWPAGVDGCRAFLESVALAGAVDSGDADAAVVLMTVHAAKGREWDHVIVAGVEDGFFPSSRSTGRAGWAEERRLLYVAVTRARHTVALTRARRRFRFGRWADTDPSPLVAHIDPDRLRWQDLTPQRRSIDPLTRQRRGGTWPGTSRTGRGTTAAPKRPAAAPRPSRSPQMPGPSGWPGQRPQPTPAPHRPPPGPRLTAGQVPAGTPVDHAVFGRGVVDSASGDRVTVVFGATTRTLDLRFAPLTLPD